MARGDAGAASHRNGLDGAVKQLAERMAGCRTLRKSSIVIRTADGSREYSLDCSPGKVTLASDRPSTPTIEIIGDGQSLEGLLHGKKDPRKLFFAGALRVRGDLRYLSDLAMELNLLKQPL